VRKRAIVAVGALAPFLSDAHLNVCLKALLTGIEVPRAAGAAAAAAPAAAASRAPSGDNPLASADPRALIQTVGTVSRCVGARLGKHLPRIVPLLLACMGSAAEAGEAGNTDHGNELRENCLQAFEACALHSPRELAPFVGPVLAACLAWLRYDPNYSYADDGAEAGDDAAAAAADEEVGGEAAEEDGFDEGYDDGDIGDDVRRSSEQ